MKRTSIIMLVIIIAKAADSDKYQYLHYSIRDICDLRTEPTTLRTLMVPEGYIGVTVHMSQVNHVTHHTYNTSCKFEVAAPKGLNLFAVVEEVNFRKEKNGLCIDYLKFGANDHAETAPLCGQRNYDDEIFIRPDQIMYPKVFAARPHVDDLYQHTSDDAMQVHLQFGPDNRLDRKEYGRERVSLKLTFTTFEVCTDYGVPKTAKLCAGNDHLCINEVLKCEVFRVDCGPGYVADGNGCKHVPKTNRPIQPGEKVPKSSSRWPFALTLAGRIWLTFCLFGIVSSLHECCRDAGHRLRSTRRVVRSSNRSILGRTQPRTRPERARPPAPLMNRAEDYTIVALPDSPPPLTSDGSSCPTVGRRDDHQCVAPIEDPPPSYAQLPSNNPPPAYETLFPDVVAPNEEKPCCK